MKQWWYLYKRVGNKNVWKYEELFGKQIKRRIKEGWRVIE